MSDFSRSKIPHARIQTVQQVRDMEAIAPVLTTTRRPDGKTIRLPPPAVDLDHIAAEYRFAPRYSQDTGSILTESGLSEGDVAALAAEGVIPACK